MTPSRLGSVSAIAVAVVPAALVLTAAFPAQSVPTAPDRALIGNVVGADPYLAPQGNGGYDITHYDVALDYDARTHGIARATATLTARATKDLAGFSLDARSGLRIRSVQVNDRSARFRHSGDKLSVTDLSPIRSGSSFDVRVRYSGDPRPIPDRSGRGKYGWLATPHGSVTYTEPTGTSAWVPSNDVFYDKATWRVRLSAPKGLMGVSTGLFLGRSVEGGRTVTTWRMDTPIQPYIQTVAFDRFDFSRRPIAGIPAFTAVARGSGVSVATMHQRTERALRWLLPRLGDYPFPATGAIVVAGADSAMETAGRPTYSRGEWNTSMATVVHEQAHQWFGNTLTAGRAQDIWLHEGFATYLENVETAERTGRTLGDIVHEQYVWDGWGAKWRGQFGKVSLHQPTLRYLLNTTPYYRGQAALHTLRSTLGEDTFWRVLSELAAQPPGSTTTTDEVIATAERVSGRDLSAWAAQWVYSVDVQPLPDAPSHEAVVNQVGPYLLDAASDFVWDPRGRPLTQMSRAEKKWQPLDQLDVTRVRAARRAGTVRYFVDFRTKAGVVYPSSYDSCLVFDRKDSQILLGSLMGVGFSDRFAPNRFTLQPCRIVWR